MATIKHPANIDLMGSSLFNVGSLSGPASLLLSGGFAYQSISSATTLTDDSNKIVLNLSNLGDSAYSVTLMSNPVAGRVFFVIAPGSNSASVRLMANKVFKEATAPSGVSQQSLTIGVGKLYFLVYTGSFWFYKEL